MRPTRPWSWSKPGGTQEGERELRNSTAEVEVKTPADKQPHQPDGDRSRTPRTGDPQSCFMAPFKNFRLFIAKSKLAAQRVHDESATAKRVGKEQSGRRGFVYFAEILSFATLRPAYNNPSLKDSREACQEVNCAEWVWRTDDGRTTLLCGAGHAGPRPFMTIRSILLKGASSKPSA